MGTYLIGVDIGTQGTKAALFDGHMRMLSQAFIPSRLISPAPGTVWQEPDDLYGDTAATLRALMEKAGVDPRHIAGIGIDGQMAGIMGVDENGEASTYYDSWLDMRCGKYMERMQSLAGKRVIALSGGPVTYIHGPKILWWKHTHPEAYAKTAKFILPNAYVAGKITGLNEPYFDYTHLHFSCLADTAKKEWSDELLTTFGIEKNKMARIVSPFDIIGRVSGDFARISGLVAGIPLVAGCGDTAASTFGSGMFERGMVLDCAGTASVLCSVVDGFVPDTAHETLTMMRSPVDGLFLPLAYINGGGLCVRWIRDELTGVPHAAYDALEREAQLLPPGSEGLTFIPHFSGRVLPNNPNLKGAFLGLDFKHKRAHMYRAALEAVAYEYRYYLSVLRSLYPGEAFSAMIAVGGGAKSALFNKIKADVLNMDVRTFEMGETALIGSAVIAGMGVGLIQDYKALIRASMQENAAYRADKAAHAAYAPYADAYLRAIDHLTDYYKTLTLVDTNT